MMTNSKPVMTRSKTRCPLRSPISSSSSDITPVIIPPSTRGRPNNSRRAIAPPMISATSVAMATNSA